MAHDNLKEHTTLVREELSKRSGMDHTDTHIAYHRDGAIFSVEAA